ncbi:hypothetical protein HOLleu_35896 [Holothuria leucospilota]|uniref:Uncharacterized protein n=1 Tax=Holothuria leucospilota TaxID=206669 RepID=A0A9Q1BG68_HOLLE|nr:hypothetical protein HOLleu_35896 [Holothuria leucospilota]
MAEFRESRELEDFQLPGGEKGKDGKEEGTNHQARLAVWGKNCEAAKPRPRC